MLGIKVLREYSIYNILRLLARQQVALVLQPGNVWVIEKAIPETERNLANIQTCLMRGWVEIPHESIPTGKLNPDEFPSLKDKMELKPIYRPTNRGKRNVTKKLFLNSYWRALTSQSID